MFPYHVPVTNVQVLRQKASSPPVSSPPPARLVVLSDHEVKSLPLSRCGAVQVQTCRACVALQDPYCRWSLRRRRCVHLHPEQDVGSVAQDVLTGRHAACDAEADVTGKATSLFFFLAC